MIEFIYQCIYLIIATVLLYYYINRFVLQGYYQDAERPTTSTLCIFLIIALSVFIGFRPQFVGSDTTQYMQEYAFLIGNRFDFDWELENPLFYNLFKLCASLNLNVSVFLFIIAAIYFSCIYIACRRLFPQNQEITYLSYLVAFSTFSYGTDGIKAGAGAAIFLVALAYKEKLWLTVLLALISIGVHHSMKVVVYAYIICALIKNTKIYFWGWLCALLIAAAHISVFQELFASYTDETGRSYLSGGSFMTGFRPDFILYSSVPVVIGYIMYFKRNFRDEIYEMWLRMYMLTNSVWMLCMYASYTNRIAYLSWFMFPVVLLYPYYAIYSNDNQQIEGVKVTKYHLWFTLFMELIYYGYLQLHH